MSTPRRVIPLAPPSDSVLSPNDSHSELVPQASTPPMAAMTNPAGTGEDPVWLERAARGIFCLMWVVPLDVLGRGMLYAIAVGLSRRPIDLILLRLPFSLTAAVFLLCAAWLLT